MSSGSTHSVSLAAILEALLQIVAVQEGHCQIQKGHSEWREGRWWMKAGKRVVYVAVWPPVSHPFCSINPFSEVHSDLH